MRVLSITSPLETQWIMGNLTMALTKLANNQREVYVKIISGMSEVLLLISIKNIELIYNRYLACLS